MIIIGLIISLIAISYLFFGVLTDKNPDILHVIMLAILFIMNIILIIEEL